MDQYTKSGHPLSGKATTDNSEECVSRSPKRFLFGSDKASIVASITKGQRGVMPAFDGKLKPEEIKAVSVYVFS